MMNIYKTRNKQKQHLHYLTLQVQYLKQKSVGEYSASTHQNTRDKKTKLFFAIKILFTYFCYQ